MDRCFWNVAKAAEVYQVDAIYFKFIRDYLFAKLLRIHHLVPLSCKIIDSIKTFIKVIILIMNIQV